MPCEPQPMKRTPFDCSLSGTVDERVFLQKRDGQERQEVPSCRESHSPARERPSAGACRGLPASLSISSPPMWQLQTAGRRAAASAQAMVAKAIMKRILMPQGSVLRLFTDTRS